MNMINIGVGNKTDYRSKTFLMDYYKENKNQLRQFKMYNINNGGVVTLLANNSGWCTVVSEKTGLILQMWAGELTLC